MDGNSFRSDDLALLEPRERELAGRRSVLGSAYRLFYRHPVHLVRGLGAYVWDADGRKYLDVYNNVPSVGHAHPAVVDAVHAQMTQLNTHTRYLHNGVLDYAEDLLSTMPSDLAQVMFMCTGSEANDLAIRVARAHTGGQGILVTREAYHGNSELTSGHSPALGSAQPLDPTTHLISAPDSYRNPGVNMSQWFAAQVQSGIDALRGAGIPFAGLLADSIFSSDGVFPGDPGFLAEAIGVVHRNGGVFISDEVQPGFGRTGESFWGFGRHGIVPDLVTMGKPMGNGIPISALAARPEVLESFSAHLPYFNTFGGNPVSIAAAQAVLDTIRAESLQDRAQLVGDKMRSMLVNLGSRHEAIGDVRGSGQYTALELVLDRESKQPAGALALNVVEGLRERGVLTSVAGPGGNILKLRPTLAFQENDIDWLVTALDESLEAATR